jgi:hypothetical protein
MTNTANVVSIPVTVALECSKCGATGEGTCNCGVSYEPARERAAKAIQQNPELSNRALAAQEGVSEATMRRERQRTASHDAVETRTGRDGRRRKLPTRRHIAEWVDEDGKLRKAFKTSDIPPGTYYGAFEGGCQPVTLPARKAPKKRQPSSLRDEDVDDWSGCNAPEFPEPPEPDLDPIKVATFQFRYCCHKAVDMARIASKVLTDAGVPVTKEILDDIEDVRNVWGEFEASLTGNDAGTDEKPIGHRVATIKPTTGKVTG